jgi:hypothetical protein
VGRNSNAPRRHEIDLVELDDAAALVQIAHLCAVANVRKELLGGRQVTVRIVFRRLRGWHQEAHLDQLVVIRCAGFIGVELQSDLVLVLCHLYHLVEWQIEGFLAVHLERHCAAVEDGRAPVPAFSGELGFLHVERVVLLDKVLKFGERLDIPNAREAYGPTCLLRARELCLAAVHACPLHHADVRGLDADPRFGIAIRGVPFHTFARHTQPPRCVVRRALQPNAIEDKRGHDAHPASGRPRRQMRTRYAGVSGALEADGS